MFADGKKKRGHILCAIGSLSQSLLVYDGVTHFTLQPLLGVGSAEFEGDRCWRFTRLILFALVRCACFVFNACFCANKIQPF